VLSILAALVAHAPALADWSQVAEIPTVKVVSVFANGDTIVAGADTTVYVSTNSGVSWAPSAKPVAGVGSIQAVLVRDGRLYAGTFGQGVHVSDNLGATWVPFNEGLVGGILNSQLFIVGFAVRGDSLYAGTAGAGVYVRSLVGASTWNPFGTELEPNQASNVNSLALGGGRLLVMAGANGMVFRNDPGETDWTVSFLDNLGLHPSLTPMTAIWTGTGWVVGGNLGIFTSVAGQEPWTRFDPGIGVLDWTAFASHAGHLFGAFSVPLGAIVAESDDDGATWPTVEGQPGVFVKELAISGNNLYAARNDGLWRRPFGTTAIAIALDVAQTEPGVVRLRWVVPDTRGAAISVLRRTATIDWVELGPGSVESGSRVTYEDRTVVPGERYAYKLLVRTAGDEGYSSEVWVTVPAGAGAPQALRLDPVYPNPFGARAYLNFALPGGGPAKLTIFTVSGRKVATIVDQTLPSGWRSVAWDGTDASGRPVASGTYFAKLESAGQVQIRKVVVAR
jgi:hypothetical protein